MSTQGIKAAQALLVKKKTLSHIEYQKLFQITCLNWYRSILNQKQDTWPQVLQELW